MEILNNTGDRYPIESTFQIINKKNCINKRLYIILKEKNRVNDFQTFNTIKLSKKKYYKAHTFIMTKI